MTRTDVDQKPDFGAMPDREFLDAYGDFLRLAPCRHPDSDLWAAETRRRSAQNTVSPHFTPAYLAQTSTAEATQRMERGWIGAMFGSGLEKPGNFAAGVIIAAFIGILITCFAMPNEAIPYRELLTLFGGAITTAIGFVFGQKTSG